MNKCIACGVEYEAKRSTSRFCSDKCKLAYHRNKVSVTDDTVKEDFDTVTLNSSVTVIPPVLTYTGGDGCGCGMCKNNESRPLKERKIINHGPYKPAGDLAENELNRVSVPGDVDYDGCMIYVDGAWHQG